MIELMVRFIADIHRVPPEVSKRQIPKLFGFFQMRDAAGEMIQPRTEGYDEQRDS